MLQEKNHSNLISIFIEDKSNPELCVSINSYRKRQIREITKFEVLTSRVWGIPEVLKQNLTLLIPDTTYLHRACRGITVGSVEFTWRKIEREGRMEEVALAPEKVWILTN